MPEKMSEIIKGAIFVDKKAQAEEFIKNQPIFYDKNSIFWAWNHSKYKWEIVDETDIINMIADHTPFMDTIRFKERNEIIEALKQVGRRKIPKEGKRSWVQFRNVIVDVKTGEKIEASPEYFITNPIPWKLGESEDTPNMDRIFGEWVGEKYVKTLYEIISYCTLPDYPIHRIFCFVGPGLNGKSKFLELMSRFLGRYNISNTELDVLLTSRFEMSKTYKKLAVMMGETNYNSMKKTSLLKRMTGQDMIGYEFKNKNPFDDYNYAKLIISTNGLPMTEDKSLGFYRRWLIINFPNTFTEKKDILAEIPDEEYENLAAKSVKILIELLEKREFTNEGDLKERESKYEDISNPIQKFISEMMDIDPNGKVPKWKFKESLEAWMSERGYRKWNDTEIGLAMRKMGFEDKKISFEHEEEIVRWRAWIGLKFKKSVHTVHGVQGISIYPHAHTMNINTRTVWTPWTPRSEMSTKADILSTKADILSTKNEILRLMKKLMKTNSDISTQKIIDYAVPAPKGEIYDILQKLKEEGRIMETSPNHWVIV